MLSQFTDFLQTREEAGDEGYSFYSLWALYCHISSVWIRPLYQGEGRGKKNKEKKLNGDEE